MAKVWGAEHKQDYQVTHEQFYFLYLVYNIFNYIAWGPEKDDNAETSASWTLRS